METIGDRLSATRKRRGLTQDQLARLAGTTSTTVSRLERGDFEPRLARLLRLASALDVSSEWLLKGDDAPEAPPSSAA